MSRLELNAIQTKLKAAIQRHQMLVVMMKGDSQNAAFKKGLSELQEEIKRLSEEQKKIVVRLRENLVKSTAPAGKTSSAISSPVVTVGQTITAIGQPRLVSFPTQGGATILPVGMVAVPIAHVQRPALGMALTAARGTHLCPSASLPIQPSDFASAVQIPTGIISTGNAIPLSNINISNNIALQNSIAINNITNAINVHSLNGGINIQGLNGSIQLNSINALNSVVSSVAATQVTGSIVVASKALNLNNNTVSVANTIPVTSLTMVTSCNSNNSSIISASSVIECSKMVGSALVATNNASSVIINTSNIRNSVVMTTCSSDFQKLTTTTITTSSTNGASIVIPIQQQPLVQPHLLQQQQQQILQMIQLQQPPQQRLASHFPIKVPQYTASPIKTAVSSTSVQYCSIAPAPNPVMPAPMVRPNPIPSSVVIPTVKPEAPKLQPSVNLKVKEAKEEMQEEPVTPKEMTQEEKMKMQFLQALDLYCPEALKELLCKRNERKRRSTANPMYSVGFARRPRGVLNDLAAKRAKLSKCHRGSANSQMSSDGNLIDSNSNKTTDSHDDFCAACGKGGQLLMCETCRLVYHLDCLKPPLTKAPKYAWSCPKCLVSGTGASLLSGEALSKVHTYITKRTAKEEERKKLHQKNKEIKNERSFLDSRAKKLEMEMKDQMEVKKKLADKEKNTKKELDTFVAFVKSFKEKSSAANGAVKLPVSSGALVLAQVPDSQLLVHDSNLMDSSHVPMEVSNKSLISQADGNVIAASINGSMVSTPANGVVHIVSTSLDGTDRAVPETLYDADQGGEVIDQVVLVSLPTSYSLGESGSSDVEVLPSSHTTHLSVAPSVTAISGEKTTASRVPTEMQVSAL